MDIRVVIYTHDDATLVFLHADMYSLTTYILYVPMYTNTYIVG